MSLLAQNVCTGTGISQPGARPEAIEPVTPVLEIKSPGRSARKVS